MRMWEIRENTGKYDSDYRMSMKDKGKLQEAYDCGFEDGYEKAMEEVDKTHHESDEFGGRTSMRGESGYRRRR